MIQNISEEMIMDLANLYKIFDDPTRLNILLCLYQKERNVSEIATYLKMNQSAISHQLKNLKQSKLIKYRRQGQSIFYSLDDEHVSSIIKQGIEHISEK